MTARYMLDTNICIYIINANPKSVQERFEQHQVGDLCMSTITYGELRFGAEKSAYREKTLRLLKQLTHLIPVADMTLNAAEHYGEIQHTLQKQGKIIGNNDLWIAAHALALNITLVTNNTKEFKRIPKLNVENWA